jgi:hypothetical protein
MSTAQQHLHGMLMRGSCEEQEEATAQYWPWKEHWECKVSTTDVVISLTFEVHDWVVCRPMRSCEGCSCLSGGWVVEFVKYNMTEAACCMFCQLHGDSCEDQDTSS